MGSETSITPLQEALEALLAARKWRPVDLHRACLQAGAPEGLSLQAVLNWISKGSRPSDKYRPALAAVLERPEHQVVLMSLGMTNPDQSAA